MGNLKPFTKWSETYRAFCCWDCWRETRKCWFGRPFCLFWKNSNRCSSTPERQTLRLSNLRSDPPHRGRSLDTVRSAKNVIFLLNFEKNEPWKHWGLFFNFKLLISLPYSLPWASSWRARTQCIWGRPVAASSCSQSWRSTHSSSRRSRPRNSGT